VRRHQYASRREKLIDFWVAFAGWFAFNVAAIVLIQVNSSRTVVAPAIAAIVVLANIAAPIVLAFTRSLAALGILAAFSTGFSVTVFEGIFFTASDFAGGQVSNFGGPTTGNVAVTYAFLIAGFVVFAVIAFFVLRAIHRSIR